MDKYEYNLRVEQMNNLFAEEDYEAAADMADKINWDKVRNVSLLEKTADIYEKAGRLADARDILLLAYDRSPIGRKIIYRLAEIAVQLGDFDSAKEYYDEFVDIAPNENSRYALQYLIRKAQGARLGELISILEEYRDQEYTERWGYELACLYQKAGLAEKCANACDELILWFGNGAYVEKALELKMKYKPLTKAQAEKYRAYKMAKDGITRIDEEEMSRAGEYAHDAVTIPEVDETEDKFDTTNIQREIALGIQQIMDATEKETVDDTMNSIKKIVEEIPYLQVMKADTEKMDPEDQNLVKAAENEGTSVDEAGISEEDEEISVEISDEIPDIEQKIPEESDKAEDVNEPEQMSIQDVLDDWEKTMRKAEAQMAAADQENLEKAKKQAIDEAEDLMERLSDVIPKLDAGYTPKSLMEETYLNPEEKTEEPVKEAANPVEIAEPKEEVVEEAAEPVEEAEEPVEEAADPVEEAEEPVKEAADPVEEAEEPVEEAVAEPKEKAEEVEASVPEEIAEPKEEAAAELKEEAEESVEASVPVGKAEIEKSVPVKNGMKDSDKPAENKEESADIIKNIKIEDAAQITAASEDKSVEENMEMNKEEITEDLEMDAEIIPEEPEEETSEVEMNTEDNAEEEADSAEDKAETEEEKAEPAEVKPQGVSQVTAKINLAEQFAANTGEDAVGKTISALKAKSEQRVSSVKFKTAPTIMTAPATGMKDVTLAGDVDDDNEFEVVDKIPEDAGFNLNDTLLTQDTKVLGKGSEALADLPGLEEDTDALKKQSTVQFNFNKASLKAAAEEQQEASVDEPVIRTSDIERPKHISELTPEMKSAFSYFVPIKGMENQLCHAINDITDRLTAGVPVVGGNLIISGEAGCGKTVLATSFIKVLQEHCGLPTGKIGKINASALIKKNVQQVFEKVASGCLIIENAGNLDRNTASNLAFLMDCDSKGTLVILEDTVPGIKLALSLNDSFARKFSSKINVPIFTNDELVSFARTYAKELGYKIDDMAVLALHNRISNIQRLDQATTLAEVKVIVDEAIERESHFGVFKYFSLVTGKRYTKDDRILLTERNFTK